MIKLDHNSAQAATELAVFGAILIFLLGTIIRSAAGNGLTQNQNFNAMRMAMLSSWVDSKAANPSHNGPSLLIVEDQLSPDFNKYGDVDRNPYVTSAGGSFTYEMLYPIDVNELTAFLPIMDVWINGQHFPFTTASFNSASFDLSSETITEPGLNCPAPLIGSGPTITFQTPSQIQQTCSTTSNPQACQINACLQNQCFRNQREWVTINNNLNVPYNYKLFFSRVANSMQLGSGYVIAPPPPPNPKCSSIVAPSTTTSPATCPTSNPIALSQVASLCKDQALESCIILANDGTNTRNLNGDMQFDLLRSGQLTAVDTQFPLTAANCAMPPNMLRCNIAWQWSANVASMDGNTNNGADPMIGLDPSNNQYPTYDIDGRLKEVTIYQVSMPPDAPNTAITAVSFEDPDGGDIDSMWDSNSCGLKPGLQNDSEIYTFTENGTYLQIKEGQLYNPQTGQVVSSINKRNNIDMIQRSFQLSNNTGRFCPKSVTGSLDPQNIALDSTTPVGDVAGTLVANPVEVCVDGTTDNCFNGNNIALTCYDTQNNMIYVRSRIQDLRGRSWLTNATGDLKVQ